MKRKPTEEIVVLPDEKEAEGKVKPVELLEGNKNARMFRWIYNLDDTRETSPESMRLWLGIDDDCEPASRQQVGCHMLQILSLKLTSLPSSSTIQLYGFMALRDPLDHLRNYIFYRSRDDPFIVQDLHSDPFIYLSAGPQERRLCAESCVARVRHENQERAGRGFAACKRGCHVQPANVDPRTSDQLDRRRPWRGGGH